LRWDLHNANESSMRRKETGAEKDLMRNYRKKESDLPEPTDDAFGKKKKIRSVTDPE